MSSSVPEVEVLAVDWSDGQSTVTTREVAQKFDALYGRRIAWRPATPEEIQEHERECARIAEEYRR